MSAPGSVPASSHYDLICIGSGLGSLACASLMAQNYGTRVLILERHFKIGGFTHTFKRQGKYEWDVGIHYVGQMHPKQQARRVFDRVTGGKVDWQPMPETFERFVYPGLSFGMRAGMANFAADLKAAFPAEADNIDGYFQDVHRVSAWLKKSGGLALAPKLLRKPLQWWWKDEEKFATQTTAEYLKTRFRDPKLRALIVSQWGDHGLPPAMSAFAIQATIAHHYFGGGWFPVGASGKIAESVVEIVQAKGGDARINHEVTEIIIENGTAVGVKALVRKGGKVIEEAVFRAPIIVSDAGAYNTYLQLIPPTYPIPFRDEIRRVYPGTACVTLYLGLSESPAKLGIEGENFWMFDSFDHDDIFARRNELIDGKASFAYLSFPSMKNPKAQGHTAEIIAVLDHEPLAQWANEPWKKRGDDYEALKERMAQTLLAFVDERVPGLRDLVCYHELSTPLTTELFTGHPRGIIYGLPCTPERYRLSWATFDTPVRNLYLTGSDALSHGVVGALMAGALTVAKIKGPAALGKIMR